MPPETTPKPKEYGWIIGRRTKASGKLTLAMHPAEHTEKYLATQEAERLARLHPDTEFIVYEPMQAVFQELTPIIVDELEYDND